MRRITTLLLGAVICLMLIASAPGGVHATYIVKNYAGVDWTDNFNNFFATVWDTAAIKIFLQPDLRIEKSVRNIITNELSAGTITAIRGDTVEFILKISNVGNTSAVDVIVSDSMPPGTEYIYSSAFETASIDPIFPPDTISFQHLTGAEYDTSDMNPVISIKWQWDTLENTAIYGVRTMKFKVKVLE